MFKSDVSKERGVLLIEVLIAIALFLAISTIIAQVIFASFYGGKSSQEKLEINNLLSEQSVKIRAISNENWENIGGLTRGQDYYIATSSNMFIVSTGTYSGIKEGLKYKISFQIEDAVREYDSTTTLLSLNPSITTRKDNASIIVAGTAIYGNNQTATIKSIITRFRNIVCAQKSWSATSSGVATSCETENIGTSQKTNIELGDQLKLCSGCI